MFVLIGQEMADQRLEKGAKAASQRIGSQQRISLQELGKEGLREILGCVLIVPEPANEGIDRRPIGAAKLFKCRLPRCVGRVHGEHTAPASRCEPEAIGGFGTPGIGGAIFHEMLDGDQRGCETGQANSRLQADIVTQMSSTGHVRLGGILEPSISKEQNRNPAMVLGAVGWHTFALRRGKAGRVFGLDLGSVPT